jgi:hypothetical protein
MGEAGFKGDLFESEGQFVLSEAKGDVDGQNIIGKIAGPFFVPNGRSRNKRFYPESLWRKTLSRKDIQERVSSRQMLGTIGHEQLLDDDAVREGKVSHITTKLEIREDGQGYGEALILGTPSGQILKTMAGAGVKMYISSRATGGYKGEHEGVPVVDESKYQLKGFDFVLDPGFLEANPSLVEELKESMDTLITLNTKSTEVNPVEENDMAADKELLEQVVRENGSIKKDLDDALTENERLKHDAASAKEKADSLEEQLSNVSEKAELVKQYEDLGTPEEVQEALSVAKDLLRQYKPHGTPDEIETKLESHADEMKKYEAVGTADEVDEALDIAKARLAEYKELGTPDEIETAFSMMREGIKTRKDEKNESRSGKLAEELKVDVEKVKKLAESMDDDEIREFFKDMKTSSKATNRFKKTSNVNEGTDGNEGDEKEGHFDKPIGKRLMESFGN